MSNRAMAEGNVWGFPSFVQDFAGLFSNSTQPEIPAERSELPNIPSPPPTPPPPSHPPTTRSRSSPDATFRNRSFSHDHHTPLKQKTRFLLAHPPPLSRSKKRLSARPRVILQLQEVANQQRPLPAFEVVSSAASGSKFIRRVPTLGRREPLIGAETLLLVRSERYLQGSVAGSESADGLEDEHHHDQDVLGKISFARDSKEGASMNDEILLESGLAWEAVCLSPSVYEFSGKNHGGLKLRWVSRKKSRQEANIAPYLDAHQDTRNSRFGFSILNPATRQHPIIATLSRDNKLQISDQFPATVTSAIISPADSGSSSQSSAHAGSVEENFQEYPFSHTPYIETGETLRTLIILTAVWVMSKEQWLPAYSKFPVPVGHENNITTWPSSVFSSEESIRTRSPVARSQPFSLERAYTTNSAPTLTKLPVIHQKMGLGTERTNLDENFDPSRRFSTSTWSTQPTPTSPYLQDDGEFSNTVPSGLAIRGTERPTSSPTADTRVRSFGRRSSPGREVLQISESVASQMGENVLGPYSSDGKQGLKKKRRKLSVACRSLKGPCIGST